MSTESQLQKLRAENEKLLVIIHDKDLQIAELKKQNLFIEECIKLSTDLKEQYQNVLCEKDSQIQEWKELVSSNSALQSLMPELQSDTNSSQMSRKRKSCDSTKEDPRLKSSRVANKNASSAKQPDSSSDDSHSAQRKDLTGKFRNEDVRSSKNMTSDKTQVANIKNKPSITKYSEQLIKANQSEQPKKRSKSVLPVGASTSKVNPKCVENIETRIIKFRGRPAKVPETKPKSVKDDSAVDSFILKQFYKWKTTEKDQRTMGALWSDIANLLGDDFSTSRVNSRFGKLKKTGQLLKWIRENINSSFSFRDW